MAAVDAFIPDDIKKRVRNPSLAVQAGTGVRNAVANALTGAASVRDAVLPGMDATAARAGTGVRNAVINGLNAVQGGLTPAPPPDRIATGGFDGGAAPVDNTIAPTADAIAAGPVRPGVIDASTGVRPASALDAGRPLPAGVKRYGGVDGSNDVIYEGRGKYGERAFGNNQFNLTGEHLDPTSERGLLAARRSAEISSVVDRNARQAAVDARAAALAPKDGTEAATIGKINAETAGTVQRNAKERALAPLDVQSRANEVATSDQINKIAEKDGPEAAIALAANAGLDPSDPSFSPLVRSGAGAVRQNLVDLINNTTYGRDAGFTAPGDMQGTITDPQSVDLGEFQLEKGGVFGNMNVLAGPADAKTGARRRKYISDSEVTRYSPIISANRKRGVKRISDRAD